MSNSCVCETWKCPLCNEINDKYISVSTIITCQSCTKSLSWDGTKIITYEEWLTRIKE